VPVEASGAGTLAVAVLAPPGHRCRFSKGRPRGQCGPHIRLPQPPSASHCGAHESHAAGALRQQRRPLGYGTAPPCEQRVGRQYETTPEVARSARASSARLRSGAFGVSTQSERPRTWFRALARGGVAPCPRGRRCRLQRRRPESLPGRRQPRRATRVRAGGFAIAKALTTTVSRTPSDRGNVP
jgi:hypothetical protein